MHPTTYLIVVGDAEDADDEPTTSRARASATRPQRRDVIDRTPSTALHRAIAARGRRRARDRPASSLSSAMRRPTRARERTHHPTMGGLLDTHAVAVAAFARRVRDAPS